MGALGLAIVGGCFSDSEGLSPPLDQFYFPTNLVVSPGRTALYVTNSDFDLQFNGGTVQVLDLAALRDKVTALQAVLAEGRGSASCAEVGLAQNDNPSQNPGACSALATAPFVKDSKVIGAFASSAVLVSKPDGSSTRLFVSVRGDPSVTFFDVADDRTQESAGASPCGPNAVLCLQCGSSGSPPRCGSDHRVGENKSESIRGLTMPVEPVGLAADESGEAIVVAHQTENLATLVKNYGDKPKLEYFIPNLPFGPNDVAALPEPGAIIEARKLAGGEGASSGPSYQPGFLVTYRVASQIDLLRYYPDDGSGPAKPFISREGTVTIQTSPLGDDQRGIAVDPSERKACEAACGAQADALACLRACAEIPVRFYVASRAPEALIVGEVETQLVVDEAGAVTGARDDIFIRDTVPLSFGASRVAVGDIVGEDGEYHRRVFVLAFDSRHVFMYSPEARRIEAVINTGRGPHAIAFDTGLEGEEPRSFMYIGHFTDSYLGVVDLDMRRKNTFGSMFVTVGEPQPPRESK